LIPPSNPSPDFRIDRPVFEAGVASFHYELEGLGFTETLTFQPGFDAAVIGTPAFRRLLDLTALVLGVSYFKLRAPQNLHADELHLTADERAFGIDIYENGLGEFYARNKLERFGKLTLTAGPAAANDLAAPTLPRRVLLPIGGGKDSLVSVALLEEAGADFTPFAVNPRGPIVTSIQRIGRPHVAVLRRLDPEMILLGTQPGYYNGHVPSTAINSMIAALSALLYGYDRIVLSNERSASEGNTTWDGREVNHQYSKSIAFEDRIAKILSDATAGALGYFSLLRPYSEARIAKLFARSTKFDDVFSSCNRNFKYDGHNGPLWCGECPKCHFVFLILAPEMPKDRLIGIFGRNLLANPAHEHSFRELTGLAGQKPWECVGEILEAAACLWELTNRPEWADEPIVAALRPDLLRQYGELALRAALDDLMTDSTEHRVPADIAARVPHAP
jgi:hypothetical protein